MAGRRVSLQLSLLPRIAELTGLTHAIQLELGGLPPPAMRAEAHAIQVTSELRSAVGTIAEAVAHAGELAFSDAGARLAGIPLSEEGRIWRSRCAAPTGAAGTRCT